MLEVRDCIIPAVDRENDEGDVLGDDANNEQDDEAESDDSRGMCVASSVNLRWWLKSNALILLRWQDTRHNHATDAA